MKKSLRFLVLWLAVMPISLSAQVSSYIFSQVIGAMPFTPITGGTVIATATGNSGAPSLDDSVYPISGFPFAFVFNGTPYTSCNLSTNGFITFGAIAPTGTNYAPISSVAGYDGAISAWGRDINSFFNIGPSSTTGEIRWEVVGTAPSREIVFQWLNFRPFFSTNTALVYSFSFQIRLQETTNRVIIIYDNGSYLEGSSAISGGAQIGLRGATNADFNNRTNPTSVNFTNSTPGSTNSAFQSFNTVSIPPGMPAWGQMYIWAPATCFPPTSLNTSGVTATTATVNWTAASPLPSNGYEWELRTSGAPFSGPVGLVFSGNSPNSATSEPFAGLNPATTYFFYIRSDCGGSNYSAIASVSFTTACAPISTYPHLQDFSTWTSTPPPVCWAEANGGSLTSGPASFIDTRWTFDGFLNVGTTGAAKYNIYLANNFHWLISPEFFINSPNLQVRYDVGATQWNTTGPLTSPWEADDFVHFAISTPPYTSWTTLMTYSASNVPSHLGQNELILLNAWVGNTVRFAFIAEEGPADGPADIDFFVDNFTIENNLSVDELTTAEWLVVYPNPAQNYLNIKSKVAVKEARVFNLNGQLVMQSPIVNDLLDVSTLASGQYLVQLIHQNGKASTVKVMKK